MARAEPATGAPPSSLEEPLAGAWEILERRLASGEARRLETTGLAPWPTRRRLVLARDAALELGSPAVGSLALLAWSAAGQSPGVFLDGPDLPDLRGSVSFGRVVLLQVAPEALDDEYGLYLDVQDRLAATTLEGLSMRARPSSGSLWCRLSRQALEGGLSLAHLGAAIRRDLEDLDGVVAATVLFVTAGCDALALFEGSARLAGRLIAAIVKSAEEPEAECDHCDLADVCPESARSEP